MPAVSSHQMENLSSLTFRPIPLHGNTADISLTVLHRNFLGVDEFLGQVSLPLAEFDVYERPKSRWFPLKCKPGQNKQDYRGEIEARNIPCRNLMIYIFYFGKVKLGFTVKANPNLGGSVVDLSKKKKGSVTSLHKVTFSPWHCSGWIILYYSGNWQHQRVSDEPGSEGGSESEGDGVIR